jgi:hypothetical protein
MSFDQPLAQAALASQAAFKARHPAVIVLVIIAKKVQKAMQGEHPDLGLKRVPSLAGLAPCHAKGDDDVAQAALFLCREG